MRIKWRKRVGTTGRVTYSAEVRMTQYWRGPSSQKKRTLAVLGTLTAKPTPDEARAFLKRAKQKLSIRPATCKVAGDLVRRAARTFPKESGRETLERMLPASHERSTR